MSKTATNSSSSSTSQQSSASLSSMSTMLRRSGVKLRSSLGGTAASHADLLMLIAQLKEVKSASRSMAQAQTAALAQDLSKWASAEDNRAVQDAAAQMAGLVEMWGEAQHDFADRVRDFRRSFETILEGECQLDSARTALEQAMAKEDKLRKEGKRASKMSNDGLKDFTQKLSLAEHERDAAQTKVMELTQEHEIVKMILFKEGLSKLCRGYISMGRKCEVIFGAGAVVARNIPDLDEDDDIARAKYDGAEESLGAVVAAREKIDSLRRHDSMKKALPQEQQHQQRDDLPQQQQVQHEQSHQSELPVHNHFTPEQKKQHQSNEHQPAPGDAQQQHQLQQLIQAQQSAAAALPADADDLPPPYSELPPPHNPYYHNNSGHHALAAGAAAAAGFNPALYPSIPEQLYHVKLDQSDQINQLNGVAEGNPQAPGHVQNGVADFSLGEKH